MALTNSKMLPLGTTAPDFHLPDTVSNKILSLHDLKSKTATVVMFIGNHCPFVKHILPELVRITHNYQALGIQFIAINSNDIQNCPEDAPDKMRELAHKMSFPFPYLFDETQTVAKAYQAVCTPDFFVFDKQLHCVYRGRFDESTPGNQVPITGNELCAALDQLLTGSPVNAEQHPSVGCNIKWKDE
jgi:peroxiredoxin